MHMKSNPSEIRVAKNLTLSAHINPTKVQKTTTMKKICRELLGPFASKK